MWSLSILACSELDDSYDALAASVIGLFNTEVIRRRGPWRNLDDVEFAEPEWVDWFNHRRLLEPTGMTSPAEHEADHYRHDQPAELPRQAVVLNPESLR